MAFLRARIGILFLVLFAFAGNHPAHADSPSVTAVLSNSETVVDQPVQLQIKVTGASKASLPDQIAADGLDIRFTGQSQVVEGHNFQFTYSSIYTYTVVPEKTGTFKIPPQTVNVGGTSLRTPELVLNVSGSSNPTARSSRGTQAIDPQKLAFAELIVPKKSAYVGEIIPVEIRLGFNTRTHSTLSKPPEITGQGLTIQKLSEPQRSLETIGGRTFEVLIFKTAIAAARTGQFTVGPVEAAGIFQIPRRQNRGQSPFDFFNDPFADPFYSDPFGSMFERRELTIKSEATTLEVKALPPKPPADFSGAVGIFNMTADAKPKSAQVGDPLTVSVAITGRGNFDRVNAPALSDEGGWHKYPPASKFTQNDDVGISGEKSFEMVLTPNERKQQVPPFIFSYFDPMKEHYVTLKSDPIAVRIEGGTAAATPTASVAAVPPAAAPAGSAIPSTTPKSQDILYQISEWPTISQSFAPLYTRRTFWLAQLGPLFVLLGLLGWRWRRARLNDRAAQRLARLNQEASELQRSLNQRNASSQQYFAQAARAVQIKTALAKNVDPNSVDAENAAQAFQLDPAMRERMRDLFRQSDEVRYSGGQNGRNSVSDERRREVLELIERLHV